MNKSRQTKNFYNKLTKDNNIRTFFPYKSRFLQEKILEKKNIKIFFDDNIKKYINQNDQVLDFGCGSGAFTYKISKLTKGNVIGVDLSEEFIKSCKKFFKNKKNSNLNFITNNSQKLNFKNESFDIILMVDVIHHLENIQKIFKELNRVLKPRGRIIIYEPNKLNPLIFLMHLIEKNERGLLKVGTRKKYEQICENTGFRIDIFSYNGIVIGPDSKIFDIIIKIINNKYLSFLNWLNPKIFFIIKKTKN